MSPRAEPYAHVKFLCDGIEESVPCSFIKDYATRKCELGEERLVFWSKDKTETPSIISRREGFIADVENTKSKACVIAVRTSKSQTAGYYRAVILSLAGE